MITPRPYQVECVGAILDKFRSGVTRQLVSLPTGTGKTILFAMLALRLNVRTLILAHRDELLSQAVEKIRMVDPAAEVGILKAENHTGLQSQICVASVQSAVRKLDALKSHGFKLCVCDEAHHAAAMSYQKVFEYAGFMADDPNRLLVGVTATAFRSDGKALGGAFQEIVYEKSILSMIKEGYLCDVRGFSVGTDISLKGVSVRAGDFAVDELEEAVDTEERNRLIVDAYAEYAQGKKGIVFGVGVEHARHMASAFRDSGVSCEAVYGSMPEDERRGVIARFQRGETSVLSNCMILTEGFDSPDIEVVMMARPTKSRGLFIQCVGRGLRLAPQKQECLLLDFVDLTSRHDICNVATLTGKPQKNGETIIEAIEREEEERQERESRAKLKRHTEKVDLFGRSRFDWMGTERDYRLSLPDRQTVICAPQAEGYSVVVLDGTGAISRLTDKPLPLDYAQGVAEDYVRRNAPAALYDKGAEWRGDPASDKQIDALTKWGLQFDPNITKGEAIRLMNEKLNAPATEKQVWFIKKNQLHEKPEFLTKIQAGAIITEFKRHSVSKTGVPF
ncbi:putative DEAD box family helicase, phage associated [Synergistales bacterium]|nr:putative DEAD box family helicase, phage associated [Synergistales bacterium]